MTTLLALMMLPLACPSADARVNAFDYRGALDALEQCLATSEVRAPLIVRRGVIHAELLDDERARADFAAALALDRSVRPGAQTSPKVVAMFDEVAATLPPEAAAPEQPAGPTAPEEPALTEPVEPVEVVLEEKAAPRETSALPYVLSGGGIALGALGSLVFVYGALIVPADPTLPQTDVLAQSLGFQFAGAGVLALGLGATAVGLAIVE